MTTPTPAWHLLTSEYPPRLGGVADHTWQLAQALRAEGTDVHVWTGGDEGERDEDGVRVHRMMGAWRPSDLRAADARIAMLPRPRRFLIQWVPHGFGLRAFNLAVPVWLARHARHDDVQVFVHEGGSPFRGGPVDLARAATHRVMAAVLQARAHALYFTSPAAQRMWARWRLGGQVAGRWTPVPSNVPVVRDPAATARVRERVGPSPVLGHFGTYGDTYLAPLEAAIRRTVEQGAQAVLLLGLGSERLARSLEGGWSGTPPRVVATGALPAAALSAHLAACDVMLQPYPDGISARRGSAMACLAHGLAIVTNEAENTESLWRAGAAVELVAGGAAVAATALGGAAATLLADARRRDALGRRAHALYAERFDIAHTVAALLAA